MDPTAALLRWVTPDENATEFFRRQGREAIATGLPFVDAHTKLRPGQILELAGPAGSAKSELLIQMVVHMLCRSSSAQASDDQEHVVLVDCDGKFDVLRLLQVVQHRCPGPPGQPNQAWRALMPRFHLVRCFSSLELLLALNALPQQLAALQGRCKLLLVDNIAAHVWHDRAAVFGSHNQQLPGSTAQPGFSQHNPQQQQQRQPWTSQSSVQQQPQTGIPPGQYATAESNEVGDTEGPGIDALRVQGAVAALLQHLSQQWRLPVVVTKQTVVTQGEKAGSARLVQREILTAPLQSAVSHRLVLMPVAGQSLHPHGQPQPGAVVALQWQTADFTGPLQRCFVGVAGVQVLAAV